jgi:D-alanine-D-alanine ligase-like ATP-grasp enzyme
MTFKINLFNHLERVRACLPYFDAEARMDFKSMQLNVWARGKHFQFISRYVSQPEGRMSYSTLFTDKSRGFIGWLPYPGRRWELARDKLIFKQYCARHKIRTPEYWTAPDDSVHDVLAKERMSSFGYGLRGPFRSLPADVPSNTGKVIYERFIFGKIAKISYWEDKLVCLEVFPMPSVTGDGYSTLRKLVEESIPPSTASFEPKWSVIAEVVAYQGYQLNDVLPDGKRIVVDYKYGSMFIPRRAENSNVIHEYKNTDVEKQLVEAGGYIWRGIPEELRTCALTVADAIIDDQNLVWFLEVNSNPIVQPDAYFSMFTSLFGPPDTGTVPAESAPFHVDPPPSQDACDLSNTTPMTFKLNILHHMFQVYHWLPRFDAEAELNLKTMTLNVFGRGKRFQLTPRYLYNKNQRMILSDAIFPDARGFLGWLPSAGQQNDDEGFTRSSKHHSLPVNEKFVSGKIARAWYWEDTFACLEVYPMPSVVGNGRDTVRTLATAAIPRSSYGLEPDWAAIATTCARQGKRLDSILEQGEILFVDAEYGSIFLPRRTDNLNAIDQYRDTAVTRQLIDIGKTLWQEIPEHIRPLTLSAIDAIIDEQDKVWLTKINSNPVTHPDIYFLMFQSLFGSANNDATQTEAQSTGLSPLPSQDQNEQQHHVKRIRHD